MSSNPDYLAAPDRVETGFLSPWHWLVTAVLLLAANSGLRAQVESPYPPQRWFSAIHFVDDWQKTMVDEGGALAYDFGPGPYVHAQTLVRVRAAGVELERTQQGFADPRVPLLTTRFEGDGVTSEQVAFAVRQPIEDTPPPTAFRRLGGLAGSAAWVIADRPADPAFRAVAWGTAREIRYQLRVPTRARRTVVLGFADSYRTPGGLYRGLDLRVEGAAQRNFDAMASGVTNEPQAVAFDAGDEDGDGWLDVAVAVPEDTGDTNVYLNAIWTFAPEVEVDLQRVIRGDATDAAEVYVDCGRDLARIASTHRFDVLEARFDGPDVAPIVEVDTRRGLQVRDGALVDRGRPHILVRPTPISVDTSSTGWRMILPAGTRTVHVIVDHNPPEGAQAWPDIDAARRLTQTAWETAPVPQGRLTVPDARLQDVIGAAARLIYQVRDQVDGHPEFQPGGTVYRGLWAHDNYALAEAALMLGDTTSARESAEGLLSYQQPNGQIVIMSPALLMRETGTVLWTVIRTAMWTGDRAWLRARWPKIRAAVGWIERMRESADPDAPYPGLMPAGLTDGGIGGVNVEMSSVYWSILGLQIASEAAQWLGETEDALAWQAERDDFYAAFERVVAGEARRNEDGVRYLPMRLGGEDDVPARGQQTFLQAVYPGEMFPADDPFPREMMGIFDAPRVEGLVPSAGWVTGGLFFHNAPDYGLAYLYLDRPRGAFDVLQAVIDHVSPALTWTEEQHPHGGRSKIYGDTPNATTGAQVIRQVRTMLVMERDGGLDVLHGLPDDWIYPGARLHLDALPSGFGPLTLDLTVSGDGMSSTLDLALSDPRAPAPARIDLTALKRRGFRLEGGAPTPDVWEHALETPLHLTFSR